MYDYLIVGAGLYGAVFAHEMTQAGKTCLVVEKRGHIAGNVYTEPVEGINVHRYGAHILHTAMPALLRVFCKSVGCGGERRAFGAWSHSRGC